MHERRDHTSLLLIAFGQVAQPPPEVEIETLGELADDPLVHAAAQATEVHEKVERRASRRRLQLAGQISDPTPNLDALVVRVHPANPGFASCRSDQVQHQPDRRRLAGAVRTEVAEHLALLDTKVEILDSARAAVELGQSGSLECRVSHRRHDVTRTHAQAQRSIRVRRVGGRMMTRS